MTTMAAVDVHMTPEELHAAVSEQLDTFYQLYKDLDIVFPLTIKWKKQPYGSWVKLLYSAPKGEYCECKEQTCMQGRYYLRETHCIIKSHYTLLIFTETLDSDIVWCKKFVKKTSKE